MEQAYNMSCQSHLWFSVLLVSLWDKSSFCKDLLHTTYEPGPVLGFGIIPENKEFLLVWHSVTMGEDWQ